MREGKKVVAVSGGFDPLHIGHLDHIRKAKKLGDILVAIVNSDGQLIAKKGYCFLPLSQRLEIVKDIRYVDEVVVSMDEDGTCAETLQEIKPDIFAKGGDRTPDNMPESEIKVCGDIGCQIIYGVGDQLDSSQDIIRRVVTRLQGVKYD